MQKTLNTQRSTLNTQWPASELDVGRWTLDVGRFPRSSMKWLFVLLLALAIFGGAAWFGYNTFVKEEIEVKKEQRGEVTPPPVVDVSLPEFEAAVKLQDWKTYRSA